LTSDTVKDLIRSEEIELISYRQFAES